MIILAIDGASRRNGKPDCLAAGAMFIHDTETQECLLSMGHEKRSTSARGEIGALVQALNWVAETRREVLLVSDSEYVWNTVSKEWYNNWRKKDWITATGDPVKNRDLWENVGAKLDMLGEADVEIAPYHIKGHVMSFGKVQAEKMLNVDKSGSSIYRALIAKWPEVNADKLDHAKEVFERNHGFLPGEDIIKQLVICNMVADLAAGYHADIEDAAWIR